MKEDQVTKAMTDMSKNLGKWLAEINKTLERIEKAILDRDAVGIQTEKLKASTNKLSEAVDAQKVAKK